MNATERTPATGGRRGRGRRAGIDLERIIEAARSLDTDTLTMQAVADKLGVDRKAVNHHVSDRESLLRLVALDTFSKGSPGVDIPADASWQEACRIYATAFTDRLIAADALAEHLMPDDSLYTQFIEPAEAIAKRMTEAGFDDEGTVRSLALLTNLCWAYARDALYVSRSGERLRPRLTRETVEGRDRRAFENLARIVDRGVDTYDRSQLDLSIEIFLRGAEAVLLRGRRSDAG
ncbi:TetR/AcrR family transcriptional regulator C-terminal domain-containing protein [Streptomyces sp. GbtcB6]|uniref:TetR/AcrR family transcriptional regulator C-terminal domain-containing protein n=1 Tax=Streptomyces sp. GbtcB6 TaxID=2824751 RepID=UPI001C2F8A1A|nr:TetR/AcrR family transcriptional regulator C-terminal domain-containing protein [Streptomyces sp. GbtcB6]